MCVHTHIQQSASVKHFLVTCRWIVSPVSVIPTALYYAQAASCRKLGPGCCQRWRRSCGQTAWFWSKEQKPAYPISPPQPAISITAEPAESLSPRFAVILNVIHQLVAPDRYDVQPDIRDNAHARYELYLCRATCCASTRRFTSQSLHFFFILMSGPPS